MNQVTCELAKTKLQVKTIPRMQAYPMLHEVISLADNRDITNAMQETLTLQVTITREQ